MRKAVIRGWLTWGFYRGRGDVLCVDVRRELVDMRTPDVPLCVTEVFDPSGEMSRYLQSVLGKDLE